MFDGRHAEYQIPSDLDARLRNWASWAKSRNWISFCGSAEKHYRAPIVQSPEDDPPDINRPIQNWKDAWLVECTWRTTLPKPARLILRAHYVLVPSRRKMQRRQDWETYVRKVCRELKVNRGRYEQEVYRAAVMLRNQLGSGA